MRVNKFAHFFMIAGILSFLMYVVSFDTFKALLKAPLRYQRNTGSILFTLFLIFYTLVMTCVGFAVFLDPGTMKHVISKYSLFAESNYPKCPKCGTPKPERCHHCSKCNECVLFMDHHCNFLGNCLSYRNFKAYILAMTYGTVLATIISISSIANLFFNHFIGLLIQLPVSVIALLFAFFLNMLRKLYLSLGELNTTTIETFYPELRSKDPPSSPPIFRNSLFDLLPLPYDCNPFEYILKSDPYRL